MAMSESHTTLMIRRCRLWVGGPFGETSNHGTPSSPSHMNGLIPKKPKPGSIASALM
jgi:hypothetical protein